MRHGTETATSGAGTAIGAAWARHVVDVARLAPSAGNTQPWQWYAGPAHLELWALPGERPTRTDRERVLGCGTALQHALLAARATGLTATAVPLPDAGRPDLLARVALRPGARDASSTRLLGAVERRCTDRRRLSTWPVPETVLARLAAAASVWGVSLHEVVRHDARERVEPLLEAARRAADPAGEGAVGPEPLDECDTRVGPGDVLLVLATAGDDPADWLRAGEALGSVWLEATLLGLAVVPLAHGVADRACRAALRPELDLRHPHPQVVLRLGWQHLGRGTSARTPRRPLGEVLAPLPG